MRLRPGKTRYFCQPVRRRLRVPKVHHRLCAHGRRRPVRDPIVIGNNGAELIFLGTNSTLRRAITATCMSMKSSGSPTSEAAQSRLGDGVAVPPAHHLFSTPSTLAHGAYPFWSGELLTGDAATRASASTSISATKRRRWRAVPGRPVAADCHHRGRLAGGCTLFNLDQLKQENSAAIFATSSCASLLTIKRRYSRRGATALHGRCDGRMGGLCAVSDRPFNWRPVWIGYDPSHTATALAVRYWLHHWFPVASSAP